MNFNIYTIPTFEGSYGCFKDYKLLTKINIMKFIFCFFMGAALLCACGNRSGKKEAQPPPELAPLFDVANMPQEPLFDIKTSHGTMRIKLYKETPAHRDNFARLVAARYYDEILFHRIIAGFMIQAGNTDETPTQVQQKLGGQTGVDYTIPAEIVPGFTHKRGTLAAARMGDNVNPEKASSGSQFYIVHTDTGAKHLDGNYTIYGEVVDGFEVIDKIAGEQMIDRGQSAKPPKILSITPAF